jgi:hypothetical protein
VLKSTKIACARSWLVGPAQNCVGDRAKAYAPFVVEGRSLARIFKHACANETLVVADKDS